MAHFLASLELMQILVWVLVMYRVSKKKWNSPNDEGFNCRIYRGYRMHCRDTKKCVPYYLDMPFEPILRFLCPYSTPYSPCRSYN